MSQPLTLNQDRLETIGRVEAMRRQLAEITHLIMTAATAKDIQDYLGTVTGNLADTRNVLMDMPDFDGCLS